MTSPALLGQPGTPSYLTHPLTSSEQDLPWGWFPFAADTFSGSCPAPHPCSAPNLDLQPLPLLSLLYPLLPLAPEDPGPHPRPRAGIPNLPVLPLRLPTSYLRSRCPCAWGLRLSLMGPVPDRVGRSGGLSPMSLASHWPWPSHRPGLTRFSCLQGTLP